MSKDNHSFSIAVACEVGERGALLIQHLLFLQKSTGEENWREKWVRRSAKSLANTYPYWSGKQIAAISDSLEKGGYIASKIENTNKYDRTKSYILTEKGLLLMGEKESQKGEIAFAEMENGKAETENDIFPNGEMSNKVDYTFFVDSFVEEKDASLFSSSPENNSLKAEKEKTPPPIAPAPPLTPPFAHVGDIEPQAATVVRLYDPELSNVTLTEPAPSPDYAKSPRTDAYGVNVREEVERMKTDGAALETFCLIRKLPRDKFAEYLEAFAVDVCGRSEKYASAAKLRSHCFSWCEIHHQKAQKATAKPINGKATIRHFGGEETDYTQKQAF